MNGAAFKAWAAKIDDEAEIQMFDHRWAPLQPDKIQAVLKPVPSQKSESFSINSPVVSPVA